MASSAHLLVRSCSLYDSLMTTSGAEMANERELNEKAEASQNRRATEEMLRA